MWRSVKKGHGSAGLWGLACSLTLAALWPAACGGTAVIDQDTAGSGGTTSTGTSTTTTSATTTGTGTPSTTNTPTPTGTPTGTLPPCTQTCIDLFGCTQQGNLCPGLQPSDGPDFLENCYDVCDENPALTALVDPDDCETTVFTIKALNPEFAQACDGS